MEPEVRVPRRIEGTLVDLRPLERRDVEAYVGAFVDNPDLGPAAESERDPDEASVLERLELTPEATQRQRHVELAIVEREDDRLLGTVVLHSFDWRHERVEVGLWLARDARGRGVGGGRGRAPGELSLRRARNASGEDDHAARSPAHRRRASLGEAARVPP